MGTRDAYVDGIKSAAKSIGIDVLKAALIKQFSFLAAGFFNPILGFVLGWVMDKLLVEGEFAAFFQYIDMRVAGQSKEFVEAVLANQIAQKSGTPEEKLHAEENLKIAFRKFVMLRN